MPKKLTLAEIAARIDAHLSKSGGPLAYVLVYARRIWINYNVGCHDSRFGDLTPVQATRYLAWLDAGNVGRHWEALRETP